jgi:hypothetical protein
MAGDFTRENLQETTREFVTFLQALDKVVPNKVDEELTGFLQSLDSQPWLYDLLLNSLNMAKQIESKAIRRSA